MAFTNHKIRPLSISDDLLQFSITGVEFFFIEFYIRGCIQKFPDWSPGARTSYGIVLCHYVQLYHYFVSQSSGFWRHKPLCCFSTNICCLFRYRLSPETFGYTLVYC